MPAGGGPGLLGSPQNDEGLVAASVDPGGRVTSIRLGLVAGRWACPENKLRIITPDVGWRFFRAARTGLMPERTPIAVRPPIAMKGRPPGALGFEDRRREHLIRLDPRPASTSYDPDHLGRTADGATLAWC